MDRDNIFIYKIRRVGLCFTAVFLNLKTGEYKVIINSRFDLKDFLDEHKDAILIGANNYIDDDKLLASLVKEPFFIRQVDDNDIASILPITLDVTQGIVRNSLIDYNNMVSSLWDKKGNIFPYKYALSSDDLVKQLMDDVNLIKLFCQNKERDAFLNWKLDVIEKYNLPKEAYRYSYGDITRAILGLKIPDENKRNRKIAIDPTLEKAINDMKDPFLNKLLIDLKKYYLEKVDREKLSIKIDDCVVNFNDQGILGSMENDYIDTSKHSDYAYLYIDFNSFGPNILINNNWLDGVCTYPERYKEIKDLRIALKKDKNIQQLYYKYLLNSGLDYLNKVYTKNGENIGLSLTVTGIMTMMLLYKRLSKYQTNLIECNTDGLIVKCPKNMVQSITNEVNNLANELNLSCDVDLVNKIVHFDTKNYVMEFADGSQKHLGDFGLFQTHEYYCSGIRAVEEALREYYLNGIPVGITLRNIRNSNDLKAFQIVKKQKRNEKTKYIKESDKYEEYNRSSIRLFAVRESNNPLYVRNDKGLYQEYEVKRGRSVKDGYYHFELSDQSLPNIHDIDLTYYVNECYKIINKHPVVKVPQIVNSMPKKNCFIDIDGALIKDKESHISFMTFYDSVKEIIPDEEINEAYNLFEGKKGCLLLQFLSLCKKNKGYGNINNFAAFLKSKNLFPGKNLTAYKKFIINFIENDKKNAFLSKAFDDSKLLLDYLKSEGYNTITYSDWFKKVQEAKLSKHNFDTYMDEICTIDDYYAKSSIKGWTDLLTSLHVSEDDFNIMIGNGTNDLVPKSLNIPSIIVNHTGKTVSAKVLENGIIVHDFSEITKNPNFYSEMNEIKELRKK